MEYAVQNQATDSREFCTKCIKIDNTQENYTSIAVMYTTGCAKATCVADLTVESVLVNVP